MKPYLSAALAFALLLTLSACARPPAPVERPAPVSFDTGKLGERTDYWRDYRAKFRLKVESKTAKFSARAIVLVKGAGFARFETFGPIGQTAALYVVNETGPSLLIPSEKMVFTAQRPETLINYFLGISLPFEIFRHTLTASIPRERIAGLQAKADAGVVHAVSSRENRLIDWQYLPGEIPVLKAMEVRDGGFQANVTYDPPVPLSTGAIPKKIRLSSSDWNMEVTVEEMEQAPEFQPSVFYLPTIPGIRTVDLDKIK